MMLTAWPKICQKDYNSKKQKCNVSHCNSDDFNKVLEQDNPMARDMQKDNEMENDVLLDEILNKLASSTKKTKIIGAKKQKMGY